MLSPSVDPPWMGWAIGLLDFLICANFPLIYQTLLIQLVWQDKKSFFLSNSLLCCGN